MSQKDPSNDQRWVKAGEVSMRLTGVSEEGWTEAIRIPQGPPRTLGTPWNSLEFPSTPQEGRRGSCVLHSGRVLGVGICHWTPTLGMPGPLPVHAASKLITQSPWLSEAGCKAVMAAGGRQRPDRTHTLLQGTRTTSWRDAREHTWTH